MLLSISNKTSGNQIKNGKLCSQYIKNNLIIKTNMKLFFMFVFLNVKMEKNHKNMIGFKNNVTIIKLRI